MRDSLSKKLVPLVRVCSRVVSVKLAFSFFAHNKPIAMSRVTPSLAKVCGDEFPGVCGSKCSPSQCGGAGSKCGCSSCTTSVLGRDAGGFTVGSRIDWVMNNNGRSEEDACSMVCSDKYPDVCGSAARAIMNRKRTWCFGHENTMHMDT